MLCYTMMFRIGTEWPSHWEERTPSCWSCLSEKWVMSVIILKTSEPGQGLWELWLWSFTVATSGGRQREEFDTTSWFIWIQTGIGYLLEGRVSAACRQPGSHNSMAWKDTDKNPVQILFEGQSICQRRHCPLLPHIAGYNDISGKTCFSCS